MLKLFALIIIDTTTDQHVAMNFKNEWMLDTFVQFNVSMMLAPSSLLLISKALLQPTRLVSLVIMLTPSVLNNITKLCKHITDV
jgi:hypothetical protein